MKQTFVIILTLLTFQVESQTIRPEINNLAQKIEKYNELESEHVGIAGETTDQYRNFLKLRDSATIDELLELLKYKNSVVKGYSSWALADKKYSNLPDILVEFIRSGEIAPTQNGCLVSENNLASIFYYRVLYQHFQNKLSLNDSLFFVSQTKKLDSVILYSSQKTSLLSQALENNNANPKTYDRIRQIALNENDLDAIKALGIYQRQNDVLEFKKLAQKSFLAISYFPDMAFWDFLVGYKDKIKSLDYFLAISSFQNENATNLLSEIYPSLDSIQVNYLCEALTKKYCKLYQDLLLRIWVNNKTIDIQTTTTLISDCPEKSATLFAKGLLNDRAFNFLEFDYNYGTEGKILPLMLKHIEKYNRNLLSEICIKNIKTSKFLELSPFLEIVKDYQIKEATQYLLDRLTKKNIPFDTFYMTEALLSFKDSDINKKLIPILVSKKSYWDIGNWSDGFKELFEKYNIVLK